MSLDNIPFLLIVLLSSLFTHQTEAKLHLCVLHLYHHNPFFLNTLFSITMLDFCQRILLKQRSISVPVPYVFQKACFGF